MKKGYKPQQLTHLIAVADISGSMRQEPLEYISATKTDLLNLGLVSMAEIVSTSGKPTTMTVIAFNQDSKVIYDTYCPEDQHDLDVLKHAIKSMRAGGTNSFTKALKMVAHTIINIHKNYEDTKTQ